MRAFVPGPQHQSLDAAGPQLDQLGQALVTLIRADFGAQCSQGSSAGCSTATWPGVWADYLCRGRHLEVCADVVEAGSCVPTNGVFIMVLTSSLGFLGFFLRR
jgi:hypothetical protein